ncbi:MAG: F0F1 ATP synthase subunit epsilon [Paracoccaceae bacterium]|nr:F0F1 ATP synthase subunit epsilon [Paracoccaceae bacterium]
MADMMQFDLVSPERQIASSQVSAVDLPGAEGDMTAMPGHASVVMTLRPGIIRATEGANTSEYVVTGGFVEVNAEAVSVLAEKAFPRDGVSRSDIEAILEEARAKVEVAEQEHKDIGEKLVADLVHLLEMME